MTLIEEVLNECWLNLEVNRLITAFRCVSTLLKLISLTFLNLF